jgi:hypothetical protein
MPETTATAHEQQRQASEWSESQGPRSCRRRATAAAGADRRSGFGIRRVHTGVGPAVVGRAVSSAGFALMVAVNAFEVLGEKEALPMYLTVNEWPPPP